MDEEEVQARLKLAQPALHSLVSAGKAAQAQPAISGSQKAFRNFGLHAEMGCGVQALPHTAAEAKSRGRGGRGRAQAPNPLEELASPSGTKVDAMTLNGELVLDRMRAMEGTIARFTELQQLSMDNLESRLSNRLAALEVDGQYKSEDHLFNERFLEALLTLSPPSLSFSQGQETVTQAPGFWSS